VGPKPFKLQYNNNKLSFMEQDIFNIGGKIISLPNKQTNFVA
jgi:hypothetical protein